ncbi:MAG TPA: enediyne biosynthesis protein UnbU [Rugosimonospora sp.]|nr:enediyne biosynthesis protein UnbU [Rugosimonospora sp.]
MSKPDVPATANPGLVALRRFAMSITGLNVVGHLFLGFEQAYLTPVVAVLTAYGLSLLLETVDAWARHRPARYRGRWVNLVNFLLPAHIAGLACAMLLYGNERLTPTIFAVTVAISSKYLIRLPVNGGLKHFFNPSNLGISTTLVCFGWMAIAPPYEFTEHGGGWVDWLLPAVVLVAGTMLNAKLTRRTPLILGWVGGFVLQALLRAAFLPDSLVSELFVMTGVAFILFTNYMITDPQTTPQRPRDQVVFGGSAALVYGALVALHVTFGFFYALTIVCAGRLVLTFVRQRRAAPAPAPAPAPAVPAPVHDRTPVAAQ